MVLNKNARFAVLKTLLHLSDDGSSIGTVICRTPPRGVHRVSYASLLEVHEQEHILSVGASKLMMLSLRVWGTP